MTDIAKPNNKLILIAMLVTGFVLGIALQRYFLQQEITISYISQSELMELEKARLQAQDLSKGQLFLGEPEKAIRLIEELQARRTNKHNIVLISEKTIYGKGLKSISVQVHSEILNSLKASKNNE